MHSSSGTPSERRRPSVQLTPSKLPVSNVSTPSKFIQSLTDSHQSPFTTSPLKTIESPNFPSFRVPPDLAAHRNGWTQSELSNSGYKIYSESDYIEKYILPSYFSTMEFITDSMSSVLHDRGNEFNMKNVFFYLLPVDLIHIIADYTTIKLIKDGYEGTNAHEYYKFLATKLLRSRFRFGNEIAWRYMSYDAKEHGFTLMELSRYTQLLRCTRGTDITAPEPAFFEDEWLEAKTTTNQLYAIEKLIFQRSIKCLLNKSNGMLVIDDELVSSQSKDVELKNISQRKKGKEGQTADCINCSLTNLQYGMKLRVRGTSQFDNVGLLVKTLPKLNRKENKISLAFDCGYGKTTYTNQFIQQGYNCITVAAEKGSRHPFILSKDLKAFEDKCENIILQDPKNAKVLQKELLKVKIELIQWSFHSDPLFGAEARIATSSPTKHDYKQEYHALVLRDVFESKKDVTDMRFFVQGDHYKETVNNWVAISHPIENKMQTLFTTVTNKCKKKSKRFFNQIVTH